MRARDVDLRPTCGGCATSAPTSPSVTGSSRRTAANGSSMSSLGARRSCAGASFEGARAEADTLAANIDVVFFTHSMASPPNQRRLERELVLAYDSGAEPVVVLTKSDLVADPEPARRELQEVALGAPVVLTSGRRGVGVDELRTFAAGGRTLAFLGASGTGKSTLVNALLGSPVQATTAVRTGDQRGRHTTVAAALLALPGEGWLSTRPVCGRSTCGSRATGIERAFADVFELMEHCRFRDCKHDQEPGCAVRLGDRGGSARPRSLRQPRAPRRRGGGAGRRAARQGQARRPPPRRPPDADRRGTGGLILTTVRPALRASHSERSRDMTFDADSPESEACCTASASSESGLGPAPPGGRRRSPPGRSDRRRGGTARRCRRGPRRPPVAASRVGSMRSSTTSGRSP